MEHWGQRREVSGNLVEGLDGLSDMLAHQYMRFHFLCPYINKADTAYPPTSGWIQCQSTQRGAITKGKDPPPSIRFITNWFNSSLHNSSEIFLFDLFIWALLECSKISAELVCDRFKCCASNLKCIQMLYRWRTLLIVTVSCQKFVNTTLVMRRLVLENAGTKELSQRFQN